MVKIKKDEFVEQYYSAFDIVSRRLGKTLVDKLDEFKAWKP
ncbi:MAG: hypothetical protein ABR574_07770 [Cryomorphaceae bacterium]